MQNVIDLYAAQPFWFWLAWLVMGAAFVLTVVTGVMYVFDALRLRAAATAGKDRDGDA